ncbi:DUF6950 family protein [Roseicitreum antarcticum]|uniref:DUF6950 domain-containing protein n=1 Tax=Roseicitreum antarcticum TaxID=564137 RepID=A0A1H2WCW9_9RHOB|nr:hypothetical protein [Roseicitreum antarcticum]SDW78472.1 hypothetical protein SAMN04488238_103343 [Roseicitreum antarcticum]
MQLTDYIKTASARPFRYGRHDCCTVAAGWVLLATGRDVLEGHRYTTLREGVALLAAHGMRSHADVFARVLPRAARLLLRAGDIAVIEGQERDALGIVLPGGERVFCFRRGGVATIPITACKHGYEVRG